MAIGKDIVAARNLGRRTAQSIQAAAANNSTPGVQRTRGVVTAVHEDGRCDVELGSTAHSMLLESIATTVDCSDKAFVGSTVLVDTFDHISVIVGVIATGENKSTAETTAKEAADAAAKAKTAADTAQQQADAAKTAADAAKSGAEDAKKLAETARDTASGASAAANKAQKAADSAAERIETVEDEITSVKEDAATTKSELEGKIQTVTDTMTADYAKKTDVEDVSTALKTEISTSAAGIRAEVSSTYASKTEVGEAVGTLKDEVASTYVTQTNFNVLSDEVKSTVASVEEVKVDAQAAQKVANEATTAANAAKEKAEQATSDASTASDTASAAKEAAAAAQAAADNARDAATTAGAEAVNAKTAADKANADLATAQANLEKLQTQANATDADLTKAKADVATAKANADAANASAEAAATAAKEANDTATSASENAKAAKTAADEAAAAATEAGESADKAKETAAAAQEKANKAAEDLAALESRVTTAETSIKQNADEIALKASKTELEDGVADAKSYSDSQLAVKANEITASVETAQNGVDTLETLVRVYGEGVEVAKKVNGAYTSSRAVVTDSTFSIVAQDGTELASYGKDKVYLGKNSQYSVIDMLNGVLQLSAEESEIFTAQLAANGHGLELSSDGMDNQNHRILTRMVTNCVSGIAGLFADAQLFNGAVDRGRYTANIYSDVSYGAYALGRMAAYYTPAGSTTSNRATIEVWAEDSGTYAKIEAPRVNIASPVINIGDSSTSKTTVNGALAAASATVSGATSTKTLTATTSVKVGVATTYTYALPNLSGVGKWVKLGWWANSGDSNSLIIDLHTGNGYNGQVYQNCHARIMVKNSSETTASKRFGGTLEVVAGDGCDASGMKLALPSSATNACDVYVYLPWMYTMGWMQVSCNGGTWNANVMEANYPTSGYTLQNVSWTAPVVSGLYWGTTLLGGRVGVKLWSGTLSKGGSITVSNLNRYRLLFVALAGVAEAMPLVNRNDVIYLSASGSLDDGTSTYVYCATFNKNSATGTTLKLISASKHIMDSTVAGTSLSVNAIWGFI